MWSDRYRSGILHIVRKADWTGKLVITITALGKVWGEIWRRLLLGISFSRFLLPAGLKQLIVYELILCQSLQFLYSRNQRRYTEETLKDL